MNTELLKKIRNTTGLSQAKFSDFYFKKSPSFIQHLEDGERKLKGETALTYIEIAKEYKLKIKLNALFI